MAGGEANEVRSSQGEFVPELGGQRILLRRVRPGDELDRLANGRDADAVRSYGGDPSTMEPFTAEDAREWLAFQQSLPYGWVIEVDGRCVGEIRLNGVDAADRRARLAIGIHDPSLRGHGLGTEAIRLLLRYAFEELALYRIDLRVLAHNQRAIACYERCGFVREGVERETVLVRGTWQSDIMMSILEQEYRALSPSWR